MPMKWWFQKTTVPVLIVLKYVHREKFQWECRHSIPVLNAELLILSAQLQLLQPIRCLMQRIMTTIKMDSKKFVWVFVCCLKLCMGFTIHRSAMCLSPITHKRVWHQYITVLFYTPSSSKNYPTCECQSSKINILIDLFWNIRSLKNQIVDEWSVHTASIIISACPSTTCNCSIWRFVPDILWILSGR